MYIHWECGISTESPNPRESAHDHPMGMHDIPSLALSNLSHDCRETWIFTKWFRHNFDNKTPWKGGCCIFDKACQEMGDDPKHTLSVRAEMILSKLWTSHTISLCKNLFINFEEETWRRGHRWIFKLWSETRSCPHWEIQLRHSYRFHHREPVWEDSQHTDIQQGAQWSRVPGDW